MTTKAAFGRRAAGGTTSSPRPIPSAAQPTCASAAAARSASAGRAVEEPEDRREGDVDEGQRAADGGEGQHAPAQGAARPARGRHGHLLLSQRLGEGGRRRKPRHDGHKSSAVKA